MSLHRMCPLPPRAFRVPTEQVVIVVVALICHAQGQIYCLKEYKISPNHTGCKNANNITTVPAYGLQSFSNDVLLQLFNSYRSSVAVGNCEPFPSAANMLKLEWDNDQATLACLHSAFLINASNWPLHDEVENRFTTRFKETGQSVPVLHNTTHRYVSYWNTVIREWFAEYQLMKLAAVGSYDADETTTKVRGLRLLDHADAQWTRLRSRIGVQLRTGGQRPRARDRSTGRHVQRVSQGDEVRADDGPLLGRRRAPVPAGQRGRDNAAITFGSRRRASAG
ncbi:hypothetical protein MTO96_036684, partial [Rhipicephalus appendiculatus]